MKDFVTVQWAASSSLCVAQVISSHDSSSFAVLCWVSGAIEVHICAMHCCGMLVVEDLVHMGASQEFGGCVCKRLQVT